MPASPYKKQRISTTMASQKTLSSTYYLAHTARSKLSREAAKPDFNLRVLVGHANMLDNLMLDLHEAEKQASMFVEAEDSFDVQTTTVEVSEPKSISWRVADETPRQKVERELQEAAARREQEQDIDSDTDSEYDEDADEDTDPEEMMELDVAKAIPIKAAAENIHEDEDSDLQHLQLTRTLSRSPPFDFSGFSSPSSSSSAQQSPTLSTIPESDSEYDDLPELIEESSASPDSDDEDSLHSPPLTPPTIPMELDELNVMRKPALPEKSIRRQKPFAFSPSTSVQVVEAY